MKSCPASWPAVAPFVIAASTCLALAALGGTARLARADSVIYVDVSNSTGIEDGTREHPFNTIREGLGVVASGSSVRVAAGTYFEQVTLRSGVRLLGDGAAVTRIDGTDQDDSVVYASNTGPGTQLDGFTVTHGTGRWIGAYTYGGGLYGANATLAVTNCVFVDNLSTDGAGGLQVTDSTLTVDNCVFRHNQGWWGGAITVDGGTTTVANTVLDGNAGGYGGAFYIGVNAPHVTSTNNLIIHTPYVPAIGIRSGTVDIRNNTIVDNSGSGVDTGSYIVGGGTGSATIVNTILWDNSDDLVNLSATYSDIEDGDPGVGNISVYPLFENSTNGDYRLRAISQCIDAGTGVAAPAADFEGDPRPLDGDEDGVETVDIGADEYSTLVASVSAAPARARPGEPLSYTITLTNRGAGASGSVLLTDTLSPLTTYREGSLSATSGVCGYADGAVTWTGSLTPGGSVTIGYETAVALDLRGSTPLVSSALIQFDSKLMTRSSTVYVRSGTRVVKACADRTLPAYGDSYVFTGRLESEGAPLAGKTVVLQSAVSASSAYEDTRITAVTGADGAFALAVAPRSKTWYRARFAGDDECAESVSASVAVTPRALVGTPSAPPLMRAGRSAVVYGSLRPRHLAGTRPVRIYSWRFRGGRWVAAGYSAARAADYRTYTRYSADLTLPAPGRWRLRAYHPPDARHAGSWSQGYDYVTVQ